MIIHSDKIEPTESSSQLQMTMIMTQVLVRICLGLVIVANSIWINQLLILCILDYTGYNYPSH